MSTQRGKHTGSRPRAEQARAVRVECYAGYRADESPRRLYLGEQGIEVLEILERWINPSHRCFKLRGDDGGIYYLRHDPDSDTWELILEPHDSR